MLSVPDSFVELGYSNIKPIERTDDLYFQYDLKIMIEKQIRFINGNARLEN